MSDDNQRPVDEGEADFHPATELPEGYGQPVVDEDGNEPLQDPAGIDRHEAVEQLGYSPTSTTPRSVMNDRSASPPV